MFKLKFKPKKFLVFWKSTPTTRLHTSKFLILKVFCVVSYLPRADKKAQLAFSLSGLVK